MIHGKRVLGIIPARGGSKGIPRKNIRDLHGKPLIAWTLDAAAKSRFLDETVVSSDDDEIIQVAMNWGGHVPFKRPANLAQDTTPGIDPVLHALSMLPDYDYVVLLQPTSPLRSAADIDACIELCTASAAPSCVSVTLAEKSPFIMYTTDNTGRLAPFVQNPHGAVRRQDYPSVYALNGAVYVARRDFLMEHKTFVTEDTVAYEMPFERAVDIDTEWDFALADVILSRNGGPLARE